MERLRELRAAMVADDCLGFDNVHAAIDAVLSHGDFAQRWECSPRLILAVAAHRRTGDPANPLKSRQRGDRS